MQDSNEKSDMAGV